MLPMSCVVFDVARHGRKDANVFLLNMHESYGQYHVGHKEERE